MSKSKRDHWYTPVRNVRRLINRRADELLAVVNTSTERILMKLSELTGVLDTLNARVEKIRAEVQALKDSLADVELPTAATDSLARLDTALAGVDDINPDTPPPQP